MSKNSRFQTHIKGLWSRTPLIVLTLAVGLAVGSCGVGQHLPPQTSTTISVRDSVAVHYIDSIRITEKTRYKDLSFLGDTLKLIGNRSRAWAYCDTTREAIIGELTEDKIEEKTKIIYKDRLVAVHDTIKIQTPVEVKVEVPVKFIPWYSKFLSAVGIISILFIAIKLFLKFGIPGRG